MSPARESARQATIPAAPWRRLFDPSYLALPFFDVHHRRLAHDLATWIGDNEQTIEDATHSDATQAGPRLVRLLGRDGWLNIACSEKPDLRAVCLIREGLAYRHDLLDFVFAIQALAAAPIALWGSAKQRKRLLPRLASGEAIGSFAVSEAAAGSDLAAVATRACRVDGHLRLDGEKCWIANADTADLHMVLARTRAGSGAIGLSVFIVDAKAEGVTASPIELVAPRSFGRVVFDDCAVSADDIVGTDGAGFAVVVDVLERYRMSVGAAAIGMARRALHEALAHARTRMIGASRLADLPTVRERLADMAVSIDAAALAVARAAWETDGDAPSRAVRSSVAKLFATEAAQRVVDDCVQLHGAAGLVKGSASERLYREIRSLRIYEGTSEIQKVIIGAAAVAGAIG